MGFSRQKYWSSCHALLQGIFSTHRLNSHLLYLLHWQAGSLPLATLGKPHRKYTCSKRFLKVSLNFYLFIFGCTGFSFCAWAFSSCAQASHCADFSCRGAQALGCVVFGLWPRDLAALRHVESLDQRLNPCPLHWQVDSYPLEQQGSPSKMAVLAVVIWELMS